MKKQRYPVMGMSCASCAARVENVLMSQKGVDRAAVNFADATVFIEYAPSTVSSKTLQSALKSAGFDLFIDEEGTNTDEDLEQCQVKQQKQLKRDALCSAVFTLPVMIVAMFFPEMPGANGIMFALTLLVLAVYGRRFFSGALTQLKRRTANMDTLVAVSTGMAFTFSLFNTLFPEYWLNKGLTAHVYYEAVATIISFVLLGKLLEERAKSSTSTAIKKLMGLQPTSVTRVGINGNDSEVLVKDVVPGDLLRVKPGEKIPVDGVVSDGQSFCDESMITGEAMPVAVGPGKMLFAGTINQQGSLTLLADKVGSETVLSQIVNAVREAQGSKAPVQRLVDKTASIFVPVVLLISLLTFLAWMLLAQEQAFSHALLTAVTVLVIACPCALGLATPTALMVGMGKGAENQILIKDAESLEVAHQVDTVVLDKTGTITQGKPVVSQWVWALREESGATQPQQVLASILLAIESRSEHPIAEAIVDYIKEEAVRSDIQSDTLSPINIEQFINIPGKGVEAWVGQQRYYVGSQALLDDHEISVSPYFFAAAAQFQSEASTVVYFADPLQVLAILAINDIIKPSSQAGIAALKQQGIDVHMLTGDNLQAATTVAAQVGIEAFKSNVMPADKAAYVQLLQQQGSVVAMVGDGINDSQALAQADISIAMGKGTDIAMDVAQITLIGSDLRAIPRALALSRRTMNTLRQNLFWAFIYNLVGIPIAAGALYAYNGFLLNPMLAAAAMALSSVSVVLNSLRLKWVDIG